MNLMNLLPSKRTWNRFAASLNIAITAIMAGLVLLALISLELDKLKVEKQKCEDNFTVTLSYSDGSQWRCAPLGPTAKNIKSGATIK